jgi:4-hydroxy-tetrahydrodipicolinate synthase
MPAPSRPFGLSCALVTPFDESDGIDHARLVAHARSVLEQGCDSVTVFGTTGEGASIGLPARHRVLGALAGAGLDMRRQVVVGVAAASVHETLEQARAGLALDCRAVMIAPPFYFKGLSDDGVFRWFARVFEGLGGAARDVILYHIPSVTAVGLSPALVRRLRDAFPGVVVGVKDSSGDGGNTRSLLAEHGDLAILVGDERQLAAAVRNGAQGAICGVANICPDLMRPLACEGRDDPRIHRIVEALLTLPVTPAVKAMVAHRTGDPAWLNVRPPLMPVGPADVRRMGALLDDVLGRQAA